ncbi:MAG: right-handed parallel beta-helix repeat-containing protein [Bacteroidales bacterium]|nr:right-handed parallel beta-helix repeat-containing protein [Bacteroidales bacterium]
MKNIRTFLLFCLVLHQGTFIGKIVAQIHIVPDHYSTIQDAIDNSISGDTVLVNPGIYYENIDFKGKDVVVGSKYLTTGDTSFITNTTIDGHKNGVVVNFSNREDSLSVIYGFTLQNGQSDNAGGIFCYKSSPVIKHLFITNNSATIEGAGGIHCTDSAKPKIEDVIVYNNRSADHAGGIGIYNSEPVIINSVVQNNYSIHAAGIFLSKSSPIIRNTVVSDNISDFDGGITCWYNSNPEILNCVITNNNAYGTSGGIFCGDHSNPVVQNSVIRNNFPQEIAINTSSIVVSYSNILGGAIGIENIDVNPLFVNEKIGDFHLQNGSNCIDAGNPEAKFNDKDNSRNDIGVYGGPDGETYNYPKDVVTLDSNDTFIKKSHVLLVYDSKARNSHKFLPYYSEALDEINIDYDIWDCSLSGIPNSNTLNKYRDDIIIWFSPLRDGYIKETEVQANLSNFLDSGGRLFISGQFIGTYLKGTGFYKNYIHANYISDRNDELVLNGIDNNKITDGLTFSIFEGDGAINQWQLCAINTITPAVSILKSDASGNSVALSIDNGNYKVVYLGFGFEAINNSDDRNHIMYKTLLWLKNDLLDFSISKISPNIANNQGIIEITLEGFGFTNDCEVRLRRKGYQDIISSNTYVNNQNKIISTLDLTGRPLGNWDVEIKNNYGLSKVLSSGLNIQEANISLSIDIMGRNQVRLGRESHFWVECFNDGNMIVSDVNLFISISDWTNNNILIDSLTDDRYIDFQSSYDFNSSNVWGVWIPIIKPGCRKIIPINITPNSGSSHFEIKADFIRYFPYQISEIERSMQFSSKQKSTFKTTYIYNADNPPKASILYVSPDYTNPWGHEAISAGNNKVLDLYLFNKGYKMPIDYKEWKSIMMQHGATVFDPVEPKVLSDADRNAIVNVYQQLIDDSVKFKFLGGKNIKSGMSCVGAIEYSYEKGAKINLVNLSDPEKIGGKDELLLTPGLQRLIVTGYHDFYDTDKSGIYPWTIEYIKYLDEQDEQRAKLHETINNAQWQIEPVIVSSIDPNEKIGPTGFNSQCYIKNKKNIKYFIYFENADSAHAAAQEIQIIDTLDTDLDWNSLIFEQIKIGNVLISLPDSNLSYNDTISLNDSTDLSFKISLDQIKGILNWHFTGIDLTYGGLGDILPPNKRSPEGEGFVSFSIFPKDVILPGTFINNRASIIFDVNPPVTTNEVINTIDAQSPNSAIYSAVRIGNTNKFNIHWSGSDDTNGSGIKGYDVYYSDDGSAYVKWLSDTTSNNATFNAENDHYYRFYSIAKDHVGNIENQPDSFDIDLSIITDIESPEVIKSTENLLKVYPNPFKNYINIEYGIVESAKVTIEIYNVLGQKISLIEDGFKQVGEYKLYWPCQNENGKMSNNGVYILSLRTEKSVIFQKIVLSYF